MSNLQFDFNPLASTPNPNGKILWVLAIIGVGIVAIIIAYLYLSENKLSENIAFNSEVDEDYEPNRQHLCDL